MGMVVSMETDGDPPPPEHTPASNQLTRVGWGCVCVCVCECVYVCARKYVCGRVF